MLERGCTEVELCGMMEMPREEGRRSIAGKIEFVSLVKMQLAWGTFGVCFCKNIARILMKLFTCTSVCPSFRLGFYLDCDDARGQPKKKRSTSLGQHSIEKANASVLQLTA